MAVNQEKRWVYQSQRLLPQMTQPIQEKLDARKLPFPDNNFDYIVASHFLEHLTAAEGLVFLQECHRTLKKGGVIRLAVPDAALLIKKYLAAITEF